MMIIQTILKNKMTFAIILCIVLSFINFHLRLFVPYIIIIQLLYIKTFAIDIIFRFNSLDYCITHK